MSIGVCTVYDAGVGVGILFFFDSESEGMLLGAAFVDKSFNLFASSCIIAINNPKKSNPIIVIARILFIIALTHRLCGY
jgi:hypothetical protein